MTLRSSRLSCHLPTEVGGLAQEAGKANRAGFPGGCFFWVLRGDLRLLKPGVEVSFGGRYVSDGLEQAAVVEPVHSFESGEFDGLEGAPEPASADELGS